MFSLLDEYIYVCVCVCTHVPRVWSVADSVLLREPSQWAVYTRRNAFCYYPKGLLLPFIIAKEESAQWSQLKLTLELRLIRCDQSS